MNQKIIFQRHSSGILEKKGLAIFFIVFEAINRQLISFTRFDRFKNFGQLLHTIFSLLFSLFFHFTT